MRKNMIRALTFLSILLTVLGGRAQSSGQLSFLIYHCTFDDPSSSAQIDSVLMQDGTAAQNPNFTVTRVENGDPIAGSSVTQTQLPTHSALKVTLVIDLTDTFPLGQVKNVLHSNVVNFPPDDDIRVISFGGQVNPATQFSTNHGDLTNTVLDTLKQETSENNRVYDALYAAVSDLDATSGRRQIILVMTDSKRKPDDQQKSADEIITLARASKAQIFAIGLKTAKDAPDAAELQRIAGATGGYAWIYQGTDTTGNTLQSEFESRWSKFMAALNTEIRLTIPASALQPDANTQQVSLNLVAALPDGSARTDQISCPIKILNHSIAFSNLSTGELLTEARDVQVAVDPPLDASRVSVEFWLNDKVVQSGAGLTYRIDPAALTAPTETMQAQLHDAQTQETLASTQLITFTTQRAMQLQATNQNGATDGLSGTVRFTVSAPADMKGKDAHFILRAVNNPSREFPLGVMIAPVGDDGSAVLTVEEISAQVKQVFPDSATEVEALAYIEGEPGQRIALSQPLKITLGTAPIPSLTTPLVAGGATLVLALVNVFLLGRVRRQRTLRLTEYPDSNPLPEQPMYLTVSHQGDTQTYPLTNKTTDIGRGSGNDIVLAEDNDVSRQHAAILWRGRRWYYVNRKSDVAAKVNGKRVKGLKLVRLRDQAQIEIAEYILIFHANELEQSAADLIKTKF